MLFLNNLANLSTEVPFVVATKYVILNNLSQTTRITFFIAVNGNLVIISTVKCVYGFSSPLFNFNFSTDASVLFFIL